MNNEVRELPIVLPSDLRVATLVVPTGITSGDVDYICEQIESFRDALVGRD